MNAEDLKNVTDRELILGLSYEVKAGNSQLNGRIDGHEKLLQEWTPTIRSLEPVVKIGRWSRIFLGGILATVIAGFIGNQLKIGTVHDDVAATNRAIVGTEERPGVIQKVDEAKAAAEVAADAAVDTKAAQAKDSTKTRKLIEQKLRQPTKVVIQPSRPAALVPQAKHWWEP